MSSLDKFEIFALCNNYILSIDSHNNEQFADNFLDDGVYDNPWGVAKGRKEILEKISYWHASGITKGKRHYIGAVRVTELTDHSAKVESNYWVAEAETSPGIVATGYYHDTVKKVNGQWKIASRKQVIDPSFKTQ